MPIFEIETDQGVFEIDADREPTQEEALQAIGAQFQPTKPSRVSKETPQTGVLPGEELSPLQQTALTAGLLPVGVAYATAPKEVRQQMTAPIEASAFGALQAAGELPGGLATVGTSSALQSVPVLNLASAISQLFGGPTTSSVAQQITEPVQDLTPKIFRAMGVETATPEGPQFKAPGFAAGGEFITNIAPLPTPAAKVPELAKSVSKAVSGDVVSNAPRLIRSATKISNPKNAQKFEKAVGNRFEDIYAANPEAHTSAASPYEGFVAAAESKLDEAGQKLDDAMAAVGQANDEGTKLAQRLNLAADRVQARGGEATDVAFLRNRAAEISNINTARGLQDAVTHAGRKVNWNQPRTSAEKIADEIISMEGGKQLNKLFENAKGPEAANIRKEWSDYKTIVDESNNRLNKLINQVPADQRPAVVQALTSMKGLAGMFAMLQGHGAGVIGLGAAAMEAIAKKAAKELKDSNAIVTKLYNDVAKNPPKPKAPPVAAPPVIQGYVSPQELRNIEIAQQLSGQTTAQTPISSIPLEQGLVGQFVPPRSTTGFTPTPGTTIPIEFIEQQLANQALNEQIARQLTGTVGPGAPRGTIPLEQMIGQVVPERSVEGFTIVPGTTRPVPVTLPVDTPLQVPGGLSQAELLAQQIVSQIQGARRPTPPVGTSLPLEAGTVRPTAIATPSPTTFSPTPGTTIPIETVIEQQRTIQALSDALRQIQAQAAQRASVSEQIAQQLGQSSRVPRIFLPEQP